MSAVRAEEVGIPARDVTGSQIVRIYRGDHAIGIDVSDARQLQPGDLVDELVEPKR